MVSNPTQVRSVLSQASRLARRGRYGEAEDLLRPALHTDQADLPAKLELLGRICGQTGRSLDAERCFTEALKRDPGRESVREALEALRASRSNRAVPRALVVLAGMAVVLLGVLVFQLQGRALERRLVDMEDSLGQRFEGLDSALGSLGLVHRDALGRVGDRMARTAERLEQVAADVSVAIQGTDALGEQVTLDRETLEARLLAGQGSLIQDVLTGVDRQLAQLRVRMDGTDTAREVEVSSLRIELGAVGRALQEVRAGQAESDQYRAAVEEERGRQLRAVEAGWDDRWANAAAGFDALQAAGLERHRALMPMLVRIDERIGSLELQVAPPPEPPKEGGDDGPVSTDDGDGPDDKRASLQGR
jgi:hypothetical protein